MTSLQALLAKILTWWNRTIGEGRLTRALTGSTISDMLSGYTTADGHTANIEMIASEAPICLIVFDMISSSKQPYSPNIGPIHVPSRATNIDGLSCACAVQPNLACSLSPGLPLLPQDVKPDTEATMLPR